MLKITERTLKKILMKQKFSLKNDDLRIFFTKKRAVTYIPMFDLYLNFWASLKKN